MDLYESQALRQAESGEAWDEQTKNRVEMKVRWCVDMGTAMVYLEPGRKTVADITVRSVQIAQREKDKHVFVVLKASRNIGKKGEERLVGFGSGVSMDVALYELAHRFRLGTVKWRIDTPYEPDSPHDRPEALPKWGLPEDI